MHNSSPKEKIKRKGAFNFSAPRKGDTNNCGSRVTTVKRADAIKSCVIS